LHSGHSTEPRTIAEPTLHSLDELERFLADLTWNEQQFRYREIEIETVVPSRGTALLGFLLNMWAYALVRRAQHPRGFGIHLRLTLAVPVSADLRLETRDKPLEKQEDPLAKHFSWSATSEARLRRYLQPRAVEALVDLSARYQIIMTDETLRIGPLAHTPAEDAEAIDRLVKALPRSASHGEPVTAPNQTPEQTVDDPVILDSTTSRTEAALWRTLLQSAGVPCYLEGYEASPPWGTATPLRQIRLVIGEEHVDAARALVARAKEAGELIVCHQCGETVRDRADRCIVCGAALTTETDTDGGAASG
jgi:hypothetical protein